tara:strand:+ start:413 stop:556 length:144 start_codon:yes stop_codon:yes gene_type:complete
MLVALNDDFFFHYNRFYGELNAFFLYISRWAIFLIFHGPQIDDLNKI